MVRDRRFTGISKIKTKYPKMAAYYQKPWAKKDIQAYDNKLTLLSGWENRKVSFTDADVAKVREAAEKIAREKAKESIHQTDSYKEVDRFMTGYLGELAVEKYLGISFSDMSVGTSSSYDLPDMMPAGYEVGVKTSVFPCFPVINRNIDIPQIIVCLSPDYNQAIILGYADVELLQAAAHDPEGDQYVFVKSMLSRKTAFTAIDKLDGNIKERIDKYALFAGMEEELMLATA